MSFPLAIGYTTVLLYTKTAHYLQVFRALVVPGKASSLSRTGREVTAGNLRLVSNKRKGWEICSPRQHYIVLPPLPDASPPWLSSPQLSVLPCQVIVVFYNN